MEFRRGGFMFPEGVKSGAGEERYCRSEPRLLLLDLRQR